MITNDEIIAKLNAAFKDIVDVNDLGQSVLQPAKFEKFVRAMQHKTVILDEARFIEMKADIEDIDRVGFIGRILHSGVKFNPVTGKYEHQGPLTEEKYAKPQYITNQLIAKELQAVTGIRDRALRRNIEKGDFEGTLVDLFGEAAGRDLEEFAVLGDKDIPYEVDDVLCLTDGWIKRAAQKVYGAGEGKDFDPSDEENFPENMFDAMLAALPKQFLQDESQWRFYVDWDVRNAYLNLLKKRNTALGDEALTKKLAAGYKGISIVYVPILGRSISIGEGGNGKVALLSAPDNMAWGIFHEITIEPDRIPKDRRTDFVLTFEGDADYEDENASVASYIEKELV
jgi:hypothetical protein